MEIDYIKYEKILKDAKNINIVKKRKNIFSIAGRGYYENPTTDILAFFLDPSEEHDLGDLVLSCLLESIQANVRPGLVVKPEREYKTKENNRIDLLLIGDNWVIALENKIFHHANNPFEEYIKTVSSSFEDKPNKFYVILSPIKQSVKNWTFICYQNLIDKIREKLGIYLVEKGESKWTIFLKEFLINIEDQVKEIMSENDFKFVLENYFDICKLNQLREDYLNTVSKMVADASSEILPDSPRLIGRQNWKEHGIAIRVYPWDNNQNVTLLVQDNGKFRVQLYIHHQLMTDRIIGFNNAEEEGIFSTYLSENYFEEIADAISLLKAALTQLLNANQKAVNQTNTAPKQRPIGLAKEIFQTPDSFFDPLPDEMLDAFEGK